MNRGPTDIYDQTPGAATWIRVEPFAPYLDVWVFAVLDGDRAIGRRAAVCRKSNGDWAWLTHDPKPANGVRRTRTTAIAAAVARLAYVGAAE